MYRVINSLTHTYLIRYLKMCLRAQCALVMCQTVPELTICDKLTVQRSSLSKYSPNSLFRTRPHPLASQNIFAVFDGVSPVNSSYLGGR